MMAGNQRPPQTLSSSRESEKSNDWDEEKLESKEKCYLPGLLQFSGPGVKLRDETWTVSDGDRERISGMRAKTSDESGRSDANFQIRHHLKFKDKR